MSNPIEPKEQKIYHEKAFCVAHFPACQQDVYAVQFHATLGFIERESHSFCGELPVGWDYILITILEETRNVSDYDSYWGYAYYLGPADQIAELKQLQQKETEARKAISKKLPKSGLRGIARPGKFFMPGSI